jgi:hypothetical protein
VSNAEPRWGRFHAVVIGALVVEIVLLAVLSAHPW